MVISVGMEPPAASFGMVLYMLAKYPEDQKKVREEIRKIVKDAN